ncbi:MAG: PLP-dependent aminotransferase family protein [Bacillota bacterium]|nr:PLP-dependent aminotransferase family protein [Bacillota bacterium]
MKAILPVFDDSRRSPYYIQLYDHIKHSIMTGDIAEGEKLPSLRNLAKSTGLSITTIEQAYNQLLVEGYIYSKAQSGYYVSRIFSKGEGTVHTDSGFLGQNVPSLEDAIDSDTPQMQYDAECFDFNKWKKCMNKILTEFSPALLFEGDPQGERGLRTEISKYLYMSRGVTCNPEQIVIGAGTQQITNQLATLLRKLSIDHVALEDPGYLPVRNTFRDRGFAISPVKVAADGLVIEKLPANIRAAAYVSPSNNAFTGSVMPVGRRYQLLSWAQANDSFIIEDDYDSELRYFGRPIPALKSLDRNERVIYLGSFSSTLFAAVKISYMVLPETIARIFASIVSDYSQTCSKTEQLTLAMFMETGYYQTHIKKLRKLYSGKLSRVTEAFQRKAPDFVNVTDTASGINIILHIRSPKDGDTLKKEALSSGLPSVVLDSFPSGDGYETNLIFYYNQIPLKSIDTVISGLVDVWRA